MIITLYVFSYIVSAIIKTLHLFVLVDVFSGLYKRIYKSESFGEGVTHRNGCLSCIWISHPC